MITSLIVSQFVATNM